MPPHEVCYHTAPQRQQAIDELKKKLPSGINIMAGIYKPHGKYAFVDGTSPIQTTDKGQLLGAGISAQAFLKKGRLNGQDITYIAKSWSVWEEWECFFSELYLYAHPNLLRPLQGICIPYLIGVFDSPGGRVSLAMETPHHVGWRSADSFLPQKTKEDIVKAYEKIHAQGVLHGDVELRHMLIGDDEKITIIDFGLASTLDNHPHVGLRRCSAADFEMEMRKVKFILDFNGAKDKERALSKARFAKSTQSKQDTFLHSAERAFPLAELNSWDTEYANSRSYLKPGHRGPRFEIPPERRSEPYTGDSDFEPLPLGPYPGSSFTPSPSQPIPAHAGTVPSISPSEYEVGPSQPTPAASVPPQSRYAAWKRAPPGLSRANPPVEPRPPTLSDTMPTMDARRRMNGHPASGNAIPDQPAHVNPTSVPTADTDARFRRNGRFTTTFPSDPPSTSPMAPPALQPFAQQRQGFRNNAALVPNMAIVITAPNGQERLWGVPEQLGEGIVSVLDYYVNRASAIVLHRPPPEMKISEAPTTAAAAPNTISRKRKAAESVDETGDEDSDVHRPRKKVLSWSAWLRSFCS